MRITKARFLPVSVLCIVIMLLPIFLPLSAEGAPKKITFSKPTELFAMSMCAFPDFSSDGKTLVALDATTFNYPSGSHKCSIKVSELGKNGKWSAAVTLGNNAIKDYIPYIETRPVISGDGKTVIYLGADSETGANYLYESVKEDSGVWSTPAKIPVIPSGWFSPDISINEKGDVFTYAQGGGGFFGGSSRLYVVRKAGGIWSEPTNVSFADSFYSHGSGMLDAVGDTMLFTITTSNNDIYVTDYVNGAWSTPIRLSESPEDEINGAISGDGDSIGFYRRHVENSIVTGRDLLFSYRSDSNSPWSTPEMFSTMESSQLNMDSAVAFSYNGSMMIRIKYLITKYTDGESYLSGSQILYHNRLNSSWDKGVSVIKTDSRTAETPRLSADGKSILFNRFSTLNYIKRIK